MSIEDVARSLARSLFEVARDAGSLDGPDVEEILNKAGLTEWTTYDPDRHGELGAIPGDDIWVLTDLGKVLCRPQEEA